MSLFDFLKAKQYKASLLNAEINLQNTQKELANAKSLLTNEHNEVLDIKKVISELNRDREEKLALLSSYESTIKEKQSAISALGNEISTKKKVLVNLEEEILLQEFGIYHPIYDFATSEEYKWKLADIRSEQKNMISAKMAANYYDGWTVNGSKAEGKKMTNSNIKQIMRSFNIECETLIDKVKFNNLDAFVDRIEKCFDLLNKINEVSKVSITQDYLNLKIKELHLAHEYQMKKQDEKEEQKKIREELREEMRLEKEVGSKRDEVRKEQKHYQNALAKIEKQLKSATEEKQIMLLEKKSDIEKELVELDNALKDIDYRQANKRAGYVYIISNIGAFGEGVYKIGMTRRLDPQERVDELGDASVPFRFDVHAIIFSNDAPKLEGVLHKTFENARLNMINNRREFFRASIDDIERVVKENHDKTVDFVKISYAKEYRGSIKVTDPRKMV
jgi:hypothetical protein